MSDFIKRTGLQRTFTTTNLIMMFLVLCFIAISVLIGLVNFNFIQSHDTQQQIIDLANDIHNIDTINDNQQDAMIHRIINSSNANYELLVARSKKFDAETNASNILFFKLANTNKHLLQSINNLTEKLVNTTNDIHNGFDSNAKLIVNNQGLIKNTTSNNLKNTFINKKNIEQIKNSTHDLAQAIHRQEDLIQVIKDMNLKLDKIQNQTRK